MNSFAKQVAFGLARLGLGVFGGWMLSKGLDPHSVNLGVECAAGVIATALGASGSIINKANNPALR